jgi:myo-inositol-1(or 4)-monophosphatase
VDNWEVIVDRNVKVGQNLADFLKSHIGFLNEIFTNAAIPNITYKEDRSPVTSLDLALSEYIEKLFSQSYAHVTFYSEEKFSEWKFPLLALDPLDGTREYIEGNPEWAISLGLFENENFQGEGWVYNPAKQELFFAGIEKKFTPKNFYRGEVSRSEWKKGLFKNQDKKFELFPVGSIAYKLGRLSQHESDFVVSLFPKNIWDIAGGTLLCQKSGHKFYSAGEEVTTVRSLYEPPLIWCHPSLFPELSKIYF